jgi:hypothetical protein
LVQINSKAVAKKHVRASKFDPWVEECEILHATPTYAQIKTQSGKEQTVSLRDLAPLPISDGLSSNNDQNLSPPDLESAHPLWTEPLPTLHTPQPTQQDLRSPPIQEIHNAEPPPPVDKQSVMPEQIVRRSISNAVPVERLNYKKLGGS